jgi:hypothetical protein
MYAVSRTTPGLGSPDVEIPSTYAFRSDSRDALSPEYDGLSVDDGDEMEELKGDEYEVTSVVSSSSEDSSALPPPETPSTAGKRVPSVGTKNEAGKAKFDAAAWERN